MLSSCIVKAEPVSRKENQCSKSHGIAGNMRYFIIASDSTDSDA